MSSGPRRGASLQRSGQKSASCPRAEAWRPSGRCGRPTSRALPSTEQLRLSLRRRLPSLPTKAVTPAGRCQLRQPWKRAEPCGREGGPRSVVLPEASLAVAVEAFPQVGCLPRARAGKGPRRGGPRPAAARRGGRWGPSGRAVLPWGSRSAHGGARRHPQGTVVPRIAPVSRP